ncbi:MAG: DUF3987 domain-containing protein [Flavobacterium sp.]|nr:MAG: DUF3987 domain-containing protein [Flavobacterium sp.]
MSFKPVFDESIFTPEAFVNHAKEIIRKDLPQFPVNVFPEKIRFIIEETNTNLMFPTDYISASILYAVSLAIGNTYKVEVLGGWKENAVIYLAIVGKPGTNKSHPLSFAIQPIVEKDKIAYRAYIRAKSEYDAIVAMSAKERKSEGINIPDEPKLNKCLMSDFTLEALATVHSNNLRGIGVYVDELAGWIKNFNRYSSGSEMEFWLSNWSGKPIISDRKSSAPINISNPFISVAGTIQNGILNELGRDNRNQNGFIDRMLFVMPSGIQMQYLSKKGISDEVTALYSTIITSLLESEPELDDYGAAVSNVLQFNTEANLLFEQWYNNNVDLINNCDDESLSGNYAKFNQHTARFALILQLLSYACGESDNNFINTNSVRGAIELTEFFRLNASKVHSIISNSNPLEHLPLDKQNLYKQLPDTFTTEEGVKIAESINIPERTFKRFLESKLFFDKVARGKYEKRY